MELILKRTDFDDVSTEGELSIDGGVFFCYTLELQFTDGSVGTAIPEGRYPVRLAPSPKFLSSKDPWVLRYAARMPHIEEIPGRSLIMLHFGNTAENTEGCVLVGLSKGKDFIGSSRQAFERLYNDIEAPADAGDCWITVQRD